MIRFTAAVLLGVGAVAGAQAALSGRSLAPDSYVKNVAALVGLGYVEDGIILEDETIIHLQYCTMPINYTAGKRYPVTIVLKGTEWRIRLQSYMTLWISATGACSLSVMHSSQDNGWLYPLGRLPVSKRTADVLVPVGEVTTVEDVSHILGSDGEIVNRIVASGVSYLTAERTECPLGVQAYLVIGKAGDGTILFTWANAGKDYEMYMPLETLIPPERLKLYSDEAVSRGVWLWSRLMSVYE